MSVYVNYGFGYFIELSDLCKDAQASELKNALYENKLPVIYFEDEDEYIDDDDDIDENQGYLMLSVSVTSSCYYPGQFDMFEAEAFKTFDEVSAIQQIKLLHEKLNTILESLDLPLSTFDAKYCDYFTRCTS